jgi:hypothetical protein
MHTSVNRNDRILINYRIYRIFNRIIDRIFKIQQIRSTIRSTLRNFEHYLEHFTSLTNFRALCAQAKLAVRLYLCRSNIKNLTLACCAI